MQAENVNDLAGQGISWMAIAQLVVPALTTIVVTVLAGWFVTRRNEKYKDTLAQAMERFKTDLAKDVHRFQVLHPRRLDLVTNLMAKITEIKTDLDLALAICEDPGFYHDEEHQREELHPVVARMSGAIKTLNARLESEKFMVDDDTLGHVETMISLLRAAAGKFVLNVTVSEHGDSYESGELIVIPALTTEGLKQSRQLVKIDIPDRPERP